MKWIVIVDHAQARIFKQSAPGQAIQLVTRIDHPEGRLRNQELKEGQSGRAFESGPHSHHRHAMNPEESPKEHEAREFMRTIVRTLELGRLQHLYDEFVLVAEPGFLGEIVEGLDANLERLLSAVIRKDLVHVKDNEINNYFKDEWQL